MAVLTPLMIYMLGSEDNIRYLIGYYQAAVVAQHPDRSTSKALAIDLMLATVCGCSADLPMWWLAKLWPMLLWVVLLMAPVALVFASRVLSPGPQPLSPHAVRWSYGLSTLVFVFFPDAPTQGFSGDSAGAKFYRRAPGHRSDPAFEAVAWGRRLRTVTGDEMCSGRPRSRSLTRTRRGSGCSRRSGLLGLDHAVHDVRLLCLRLAGLSGFEPGYTGRGAGDLSGAAGDERHRRGQKDGCEGGSHRRAAGWVAGKSESSARR